MSRVLVLMYHQVDSPRSAQEQRFCTPPADFDAQMRHLVDAGYRGVSLDEVRAHVAGERSLPGPSVHVSFDDGFVGVLEHAWPTLKALGLPATLFALPGRTGDTNDWMHGRGFPRRALLSASQLRTLADEGMAIGSHTNHHVRLTDVDTEVAREEIGASRLALQDLLGREVTHFAYPYGKFTPALRDMVQAAGYRCACSTRAGFNRAGEDPFLIRRLDIAGTDRPWAFRQKLRMGTHEATRWGPLAYYAGRVAARFGRGG